MSLNMMSQHYLDGHIFSFHEHAIFYLYVCEILDFVYFQMFIIKDKTNNYFCT